MNLIRVMITTLFTAALSMVAGVADASNNAVSEATEAAENVKTALEVASDSVLHLTFGAAVGTGVGLLLGSGIVFVYWRRQIG